MMANAGYEVWIGNTRSSNYTFGHLTYTRKDKVSHSPNYQIMYNINPTSEKSIKLARKCQFYEGKNTLIGGKGKSLNECVPVESGIQ